MAAESGAELAATRLQEPRFRVDDIGRPDLLDQLPGGSRATRVTTVIGPAGWGKSTLLGEWIAARSASIDVAYLAVDSADADPRRFLDYLDAVLRSTAPDLPLSGGVGSASEWVDMVLPGVAAAIADRGHPVAVALDDYHLVANSDVHVIAQGLINAMPTDLFVVIAARSDPPLHLARLRAAREVTDLRTTDLGFSTGEAERVLSSAYGLRLGADSLGVVHRVTEGWPAGICLAGISLAAAPDPETVALHLGHDRHLADFFAEEVLVNLEPELFQFLMQTSVLERFSAPLAEATTGQVGARQTIAELERRHLFLTALDLGRQWFRYHHLMSDLLRVELLRRHSSAEVAEIHLRAARWLEADGQIRPAVEHFFTAEAHDRAAELVIAKGYGLAYSERVQTVVEWCDRLPDQTIEERPEVCMLAVFARRNLAHDAAALKWLDRYETAVPDPDPAQRLAVLDARTWLTFAQGRLQASASFAEEILQLRPQLADRGNPTPTAATDVLNGILNAALALFQIGDERAVPLLEEVLGVGHRSDAIDLQREAAAGALAVYHWGRGEDDQAASRVLEARQLRGDRTPQTFSIAWMIPAVLLEPESIEDSFIARMTELGQRYSSPHLQALIHIAEAVFLDRIGQRHDAAVAVGEVRELLAGIESSVPTDLVVDRAVSLIADMAPEASNGTVPLTDRELQILRALSGPLTQREIGRELFLSFNTIKTYSRSVYRKLGVQSRAEAVARGRELQLLPT